MRVRKIKSADGTLLRIGQWGDGDRSVLLMHGLAEHLARYEHVGAALAGAGWTVTMVEVRGHGESDGRRGHVRRWQQYVEDMQAGATVAAEAGPVVVVAHSTGGLTALEALRVGIDPLPRAIAISNPLLRPKVEAPAYLKAISGLLSRLLPTLPIKNEIDARLLSRDPEVGRRYVEDPLVFGSITPRWFTEMLATQQNVHAHAAQYTTPLLMMLGTGDQICDHEVSHAFVQQYGGPTAEKRYEGRYHELFNETDKEDILADLIEWLDPQVG